MASRIGDARETLVEALCRLPDDSIRVARISRFYRTPAVPSGSGPDYVNAAAVLETSLAPDDLLSRLLAVEASLGRVRRERWGARTVDLDLLFLGAQVIPDRPAFDRWVSLPLDRQKSEAPDELILPHPRLQDRPFVLIPLAEIAGGWLHPVTGLTVTQMAAALPEADKADIGPIERPFSLVKPRASA